MSLLIVAFLRPIRDMHCVSKSRTRWLEAFRYYLSVTQADCCSSHGDLESEPDDLISIFHEMSGGGGTWTRGKDVVLWSQLMTRFLLHSPRFLKKITKLLSSQNHFYPNCSSTTTFVAPCLWGTFVEGSLLRLSALLRPGDLWLVPGLSLLWRPLATLHGLYCAATWHRLYCAVHCTVLSTLHHIIGTSSSHGFDDK